MVHLKRRFRTWCSHHFIRWFSGGVLHRNLYCSLVTYYHLKDEHDELLENFSWSPWDWVTHGGCKGLPQPTWKNLPMSQGVIKKTHITSQNKQKISLNKNNTLTKSPSESLIESNRALTPSQPFLSSSTSLIPRWSLKRGTRTYRSWGPHMWKHNVKWHSSKRLDLPTKKKRHTETWKKIQECWPCMLDPFQHGSFEPSEATSNFREDMC